MVKFGVILQSKRIFPEGGSGRGRVWFGSLQLIFLQKEELYARIKGILTNYLECDLCEYTNLKKDMKMCYFLALNIECII